MHFYMYIPNAVATYAPISAAHCYHFSQFMHKLDITTSIASKHYKIEIVDAGLNMLHLQQRIAPKGLDFACFPFILCKRWKDSK